MSDIFGPMRARVRKSIERDRSKERYFEAASRSLWPWRESKLLATVSLVALLDYLSTYAFLALSGNMRLTEGGPLARWALHQGGLSTLFLIDLAAVAGLAMLAVSTRLLYTRFGFQGFGRAAFVFVLVPYLVIALAAVFNNVVLTFI